MTNEELAALLQDGSGGEDELLCLWAQVRRFAASQARRWARASTGVEVEDLLQVGFLALLDALGTWNRDTGMCSSLGTRFGSKARSQRLWGFGQQGSGMTRSAVPFPWTRRWDMMQKTRSRCWTFSQTPRRSGKWTAWRNGISRKNVPGYSTGSWISWTKRSGRQYCLFTASASQFPRQPPGSSWTRQPCAALQIPACDFSADLQTPGSCWACGHKQRHPFFRSFSPKAQEREKGSRPGSVPGLLFVTYFKMTCIILSTRVSCRALQWSSRRLISAIVSLGVMPLPPQSFTTR